MSPWLEYAPEYIREEETETFYNMLQEEIDKSVKKDHLFIAGDLKARVGNSQIPSAICTQGESTINENGNTLKTFVNFNKLKVTNIFFQNE